MKVKFVFILKSGKTFECIEDLSKEQFEGIVQTICKSMRDNRDGVLFFEECCVRLTDCSVAEWEVFESEESSS